MINLHNTWLKNIEGTDHMEATLVAERKHKKSLEEIWHDVEVLIQLVQGLMSIFLNMAMNEESSLLGCGTV
jgi:hypothetical protein